MAQAKRELSTIVTDETALGSLIREVRAILDEARCMVINFPQSKGGTWPPFIPHLAVVGNSFKTAIECKLVVRDRWARERFERLVSSSGPGSGFLEYNEFWMVCRRRSNRVTEDLSDLSGLRVMDLGQLREHLRLLKLDKRQQKPPKKKKAARTKIGKAVDADGKGILVRIAALMIQIEDASARLGLERPNSDEGIAAVNAKLLEYASMLAQLESIRVAVAQYMKGDAKEKAVVQEVGTFKGTVQSWWMKGHERICNTAADSAIFLGSAGLLHGMNADSSVALAIAGALIGGDSVAKCLKALPRKLF